MLFLLMCGGLLSSVHATHLVGGEMYYTYLGDNVYEFHLIIYRDCGPTNTNGTDFDFSAPIGIYTPDGNFVSSTTVSLLTKNIEEVDLQSSSACAVLPPEVCIERAEYTFELDLPPTAAGYTIVYQRCCRNPQIINLSEPISTGFTISANIPGTDLAQWGNSSPAFTTLPQAYVCQGHPFTLENPAFDPDIDSLVYSLCPIYHGGSYTAPTPNPPTGPPFTEVDWELDFSPSSPFGAVPISIDPATGTLSGTPNLVGKYAIGVCIAEYRDGEFISRTLRDFTIDVVPCEILVPDVQLPDPCAGLAVTLEIDEAEGSYSWDFGPATLPDSLIETSPSVVYPEEGIYTIGFSYQLGDCTDSISFDITVVEPRQTSFTISEPVCDPFGYTFDLTYTGDDPAPGDFSWWVSGDNPGGTSPMSSHLTPGTHEVEAEVVVLGCTFSTVQELDLPDLPAAQFTPGSPPCNGLAIPFDNFSTGADEFHWTFNVLDPSTGSALESSQQNPVWNYPDFGSYTARLVADPDRLCADTAYADILVLPEDPLVMAMTYREPPACSMETFGEFSFIGEFANTVQWDFGAFGTVWGDSAEVNFGAAGSFPVTLTIFNDTCQTQQSVDFDFEVPALYSSVKLIVPNVLTPNADGKNDRFRIALQPDDGSPIVGAAAQQFNHYNLQVFNRWGVLVYSAEQYGAGWDGSVGGSPGSAGTYYFILDADHACEETTTVKQGELTLIRD